jgi:hypothetical protein
METVGPTQRTRLHRGWTEQTAEPATEGARRLGHGSYAADCDEARAFAQSRFLERVRHEAPDVLRSLADLAGWNDGTGTADLDAEQLTEWAARWNLTDAWCLSVARATAAAWVGPTWELLREECAAEGSDWRDRLDWTYPVAIVADPLDDETTAIPALDPAFLDWNPRLETWERAEERMVAAFLDHIRRHRERIRAATEAADMMRTDGRTPRHFSWLALYQTGRQRDGAPYSQTDLANLYAVNKQSVSEALRSTAALCGITLRQPGRAGRRANAD